MKDKIQNKYVAWGLTLFCVCAALLLLFFAIYRWDYIFSFIKTIVTILMPFIYGLVIAYLMNPVVNFLDQKVFDRLVEKMDEKTNEIPTIPEILKSLEMLVTNINIYLSNTKEFFIDIFGGSEEIRHFIDDNYGRFSDFLTTWMNDGKLNDMVAILGNSIFGTLKFIYNMTIGYIISIYVLFDKEKFKAQIKKLLYSFFDKERVNIIVENTIYTDRIFGDFFNGKLIDSLIIGIICFVFMVLFKMPYALIIALLVGITNVIPYFGPFIGAIPSAFLIFLVSPDKCILFLIFIFILQQIDGNIIGPKILGGKIGLSSFWVLFSLLIFGGLFGIVGMIIGVPIFSIIYSFVNGLVKKRLESKNLPVDSKDYEQMIYVDKVSGKPVYKKR